MFGFGLLKQRVPRPNARKKSRAHRRVQKCFYYFKIDDEGNKVALKHRKFHGYKEIKNPSAYLELLVSKRGKNPKNHLGFAPDEAVGVALFTQDMMFTQVNDEEQED